MTADTKQSGDQWADWLLRGRQHGMTDHELRMQQRGLTRIRDRTLRGARLRKGHHVLDVGAGTGLLALEVCRRVGPTGFVCGLDISFDALAEARRLGTGNPDQAQLTCIGGTSTALPFADAGFDAVLTRSVLIYVSDKAAAAREFFRVLKPGGHVSIFEPINRAALKHGDYGNRDFGSYAEAHKRVLAYQYEHWPHRAAMMDFDERDLVQWFVDAGFRVALSYEHKEGSAAVFGMGLRAPRPEQVAAALARRYNPSMPSYAEAARAVLGANSEEHLVQIVNVLVVQPSLRAFAAAYLTAIRPKA